MLTTVGLRTGVAEGYLPGYVALKLLFTLSLIGVGAASLDRLMRPGQEGAQTLRVCVSSFLHCYMCRRCFSGIWAADGMGAYDFRNAVGDLPALYPALCCRSICSVDLGFAQRSAHEFEASRGHRGTCRRGVRRDGLRISLPGRLRTVHRDLVRHSRRTLRCCWCECSAHGFCGGDRFTSAPKREPRHPHVEQRGSFAFSDDRTGSDQCR